MSTETNNKKSVDSTEGAEGTSGETGNEEVPPLKEMKAVTLTAHGGLKGLRVQNRTESVISEGEVLIRVKAWYVKFLSLAVSGYFCVRLYKKLSSIITLHMDVFVVKLCANNRQYFIIFLFSLFIAFVFSLFMMMKWTRFPRPDASSGSY